MESKRFDTFVRTLELTASRRQALAGLLGGALVALSGIDAEARRRGKRRRRGQGRLHALSIENGDRGRTRTTICHKPGMKAEKTLEISSAAVDAHLGHGDHLGPCTDPPAPGCVEDAQCGPCQACVEAECRPARECGGCVEGGILGTCQGGICRTDGSGCQICVAPLVFCAETGECEECCPLCPTCQTCVDGECQPANECGRCEGNGIFGICQRGNCLTDGSACAPPDSEA